MAVTPAKPMRSVFTLLALLVALFAPGSARAWTEAHPSALATDVVVDRDGSAIYSVRVRWTVMGGRLHQFELADLPNDFTLLEASAIDGNGGAVAVTTHTSAPGRLDVSLGDDVRGVRRGSVEVLIRYGTSLRAQGAIQRAGSEAVVEIPTLPWARAIEGVTLRVSIPTAQRRAQWVGDESPGLTTSIDRDLSHDVVRATRRQLPANERWSARVAVDPAVFPWLSTAGTRRVVIERRARAPYEIAGLLALGLCVAVALFARLLGRVSPPAGVARRSGLSPSLAAVGVIAQSLHVLRVPYALLAGTLLLALAAALRLPSTRVRAAAMLARVTARTVAESDLTALAPARFSQLRVVAHALAALAAGVAVAASAQGFAWAAVVAIDLALAAALWTAWSSRVDPLPDAAVLLPVGARVRSFVHRSERVRLAWRVRGDLRAGGSVSLRLVPLPGWRHVRGLRAVECVVVETMSALGASLAPELTLRLDPGSPTERALRLLAARVGAVTLSPEGEALTYRATLLGADADVALAGLRDMMGELFIKAPPSGSVASSRSAAAFDRSAAR